MSGSVRYKYCIVPLCKSTTSKTPEKAFLSVPRDQNLRKKWLRAMRRDEKKNPKMSSTSVHHVCEDHFDLQNDLQNYMQHRFQGGKMFLKKGVLPHIFHCQKPPTPSRTTGERQRRNKIISSLMNCQPLSQTGSSLKVDEMDSDHFNPVCENELQASQSSVCQGIGNVKEEMIDSDHFSPVCENELQASQSSVCESIGNVKIKEEMIDSDHFSPVRENELQVSQSPVCQSIGNVKIKEEMIDSDHLSPVRENELQASHSPVHESIENIPKIKEEPIDSDHVSPVRENEFESTVCGSLGNVLNIKQEMIDSNHFSFTNSENELQSPNSPENRNIGNILKIEEEKIDSEHFSTASENNKLLGRNPKRKYNLLELFTFKEHSNYNSESTHHGSLKSDDIMHFSGHEFHGNRNKKYKTDPVVLNRRRKQTDYGKDKKRHNHKNKEYETDPIVLARRQRQIDYGKNTKGYRAYLKAVRKRDRVNGKHISTPKKHLIYSRRSWDSQIKIWRKRLHEYDPESGDEDDNEVDLSGMITMM